MLDIKPLTPAKVRSVLAKAGHTCAKSHPTRIRGWRSWTEGYRVTELGGEIVLEHAGDYIPKEREIAKVATYCAALQAAGLHVTPAGPRRVHVSLAMATAADAA